MTTKMKHNLALVGVCLFVLIGVIVAVLAVSPRNVTSGAPGETNVIGTEKYNVPQAGFELPMVNLEGNWSTKENDTAFNAVVKGDDIKIEMVTDDGVSALYWHGTFKPAESPKATITSTKTEASDEIVISQSATKDFTIGGDTITFKFSALGFSKNLELHR